MAASYVAGVIAALAAGLTQPNVPSAMAPPPLPPNAGLPFLTIHQIFDEQLQSLTGDSGLTETIIQVNCWHSNYESAFLMRQAVRDVLLPFKGAIASVGLTVDAVNQLPGTELYDGVRELHQVIARFRIWWSL